MLLQLFLYTTLGCSDWMMNDVFGLSVRTMDLGVGPEFGLKSQPRGSSRKALMQPTIGAAKFGHIISIGANPASRGGMPLDTAQAGLNEAGLSCDWHTLLNSSYPNATNTPLDLELFFFCNWALGSFATAKEVRAALTGPHAVHLWGPKSAEQNGAHFIVRDATGMGLAVEFLHRQVVLYDDYNDGGLETGVGVFTNEPPLAWQWQNVAHYRWKQSLARPATTMPGTWYPDERFLRVYLTKTAMPIANSYAEAVQHALHVLNTITVPMGLQMGTDSGFGEGEADHTHYANIYDHKNATLYWRQFRNLNLQRVTLSEMELSEGSAPKVLSLSSNGLPWFNDAAHAFA
jgi:penicillin V acylase-like amidase (Ntn superfamily)